MGKAVQVTFSHSKGWDDLYPPVPAVSMLPEWYKQQPHYLFEGKKIPSQYQPTPSTIKRCVPVFDALTTGYLIRSQADVYVTRDNGAPYFQWKGEDTIVFHPKEQAGFHPTTKDFNLPKWTNPWVVVTPPGYSSLFIPPVHSANPFRIMEGVVDTDVYGNSVEFPFAMTDDTWEGLIPAGTPIAQVIPFKRETYEMEIKPVDAKKSTFSTNLLNSVFFDGYRKTFWNKKEYR